MLTVRTELSPLGVPHSPALVPEAPWISARTPRLCPAPPLPGLASLPGFSVRCTGEQGAAANPACACDGSFSARRRSTRASLAGKTLLSMLSAPPESQLSRGRDRFSVFLQLPRGR